MNLLKMLNDLDDTLLPFARNAVRQLIATEQRKAPTDDDLMNAIAATVEERQLALVAKPARTPIVYCSTPELCISTEQFARQVGLAPQQIRLEYLNSGSFRNVSPLPLYDGSLAWPLYRVDKYLKQQTAQLFNQ